MCLVISLLIFFRSFFPYKPKESPCAKLFAHAWKKNVEEFVKLQMAASKKRGGPLLKCLPLSFIRRVCQKIVVAKTIFLRRNLFLFKLERVDFHPRRNILWPTTNTPASSKADFVATDHSKTSWLSKTLLRSSLNSREDQFCSFLGLGHVFQKNDQIKICWC